MVKECAPDVTVERPELSNISASLNNQKLDFLITQPIIV
jgi:hypothetical protein